MTNIELLQKTMLFRGSKYEELELVLGLFQERQLRQNAVIFSERTPGEALYIVKSGKVRITMLTSNGSETSLLLLGPGEFFGELSLIQEDLRLVTARTETPAEILLLTRKDFQVLLELAPRTASRALVVISRLLAMRVKAYSDRLKELLLL